ncbi:MAG: hypothetical protein QM760_21370 [Nibricoccus sp.]
MIAPAFAEILRTQRDAFNARFTAARRRWTHLDAADFSLFLRDQLSPLVAAVASKSPDHANRVAHAGYDLGLQLVAEKLAGPSARHACLNTLWSSTFPRLASLIAADPRPVLASLSNATHQLATSPGVQIDVWFENSVPSVRNAPPPPSCSHSPSSSPGGPASPTTANPL